MAKILKQYLEGLFVNYSSILGVANDDEYMQKNIEVFEQACQYIEDYDENAFDWDNLSQPRINRDLVELFKKCFTIERNELIFDQFACQTALLSREQQFNDAKQVYLAQDIESTGIQEKYLKCQLTSNEPLTELDIKRFILATKMVGKIQVIDLTEEKVRLALSIQRKEHAIEPYSVVLMVNAGSKTPGENPQWLSLVVSVDPLSYNISYKIQSEEPVSPEQELIIKKAINGDDASTNYSAFPQAASVFGTVQQLKLDAGKPSGGYKVLHQLYSEATLEKSEQATRFVSVESSAKAIRNAVYEVELRAIRLTPDDQLILTPQISNNFNEGLLENTAIESLISFLSSAIPAVSNQHPLVTEKISGLQLYHNKVNFPGDMPSTPLSSVDYQQFLLLVNEKFKSSGTNKILNEMVLPCDSTAIQGLIAYNETHTPLPFKSLSLDLKGVNLSDKQVYERILFNLKSALMSLSDNHLASLTFADPDGQLTSEMVEELARFVHSRHISVDITLPVLFQTSKAQRIIDEAVSDNLRERTIQDLDKKIAKAEESQPVITAVRTRPNLSGRQNLTIDIELQQEQQVEVAVEAGLEKTSDSGVPVEAAAEVYDLEKFQEELSNGHLAISSKSYLVNNSKSDEVGKLWRNWLGFLTNADANQRKSLKLSKTACEELLRNKDKFQYGLDLRELPPGFVLKTQGPTPYIHFDENLTLLSGYNPLQIQTAKMPESVPLPNIQFKACIEGSLDSPIKDMWDKINNSSYDKSAHRLFKQYLPQMLLLDAPQLTLLSSLCFKEDGSFDKNKFEFLLANAAKLKIILEDDIKDSITDSTIKQLFEDKSDDAKQFLKNYQELHPDFDQHILNQLIARDKVDKTKFTNLLAKVPDLNLNGILQVYIQLGEKGIDSLARIVDEDIELFKNLNTKVFAKNNSYMPLLSEEYQDALKAIKGFSNTELLWWDNLLTQHCAAQSDVNLVDLVNAFKQFKEELGKLPDKDDQRLLFPSPCLLKGVMSLPVVLSRILTLLKHTNQENRLEQWKVLSTLDFSSSGVPKLMEETGDKRWAFISPEMQINLQHEVDNPTLQNTTRYQPPRGWKAISKYGTDKLVENFFRFAAYQAKDGQLSLEFYHYADEAIKTSGLSPQAQQYMYGLIASATTEGRNVNSVKSLEEAKKDCDSLIKLIKRPPALARISESLAEEARIELLETLYQLEYQPPLPVLNRLVSLISSSINTINLSTLVRNIKRLEAANVSLKHFVGIYGAYVYDGMKDYADSDYTKSDLFFNHIEILKTIQTSFDEYDFNAKIGLIRLISTFQIKKEDIARIVVAHFGDEVIGEGKKRRDEALLCILHHVSRVGQKELTAEDLIAILHKVREPSEKEVIHVIRDIELSFDRGKLAAYLPESILDNYGKKGIPEDVKKLIADNFNEQQKAQIETMLLRFHGPTDSAQYNEVVKKLILITKPPLPALEKNIFIAKLCSSLGLYSDIKPLEAESNQFVQLLDAIITSNSPDAFINFIAAERNLLRASSPEQIEEFFIKPKPTEPAVANLAQKGLLFIDKILPGIREIGDLNLSQVDFTPRILKTLLKTPAAQLDAVSTVVTKEEIQFDRFDQSLSDVLSKLNDKEEINFKSLKSSTDSFLENSGLKENESYKKYSDYIEQISQPKISTQDANGVAKNPTLLILALFLTNPEAIPAEKRELFNQRYQGKIKALIEKYPGIMLNRNSLNFLLNNPEFYNALTEKDTIEAAKDPNLLEDDARLDMIFAALDKDLKGISAFTQQTKELQNELRQQKDALHTYPIVFNNLYKKINQIAGDNLNSKKQFLELFDTYLEHYSPTKHGELMRYLTDFVSILENSFARTVDKNIVLSLCLQFNNDEDEELTPESLVELLKTVDEVPQIHQETVLKIAVALINNEKEYTLEDFKKLCDVVKKDSKFALALQTIYKKAPFPMITQVLKWHGYIESREDYAQKMAVLYKRYSTKPCHRESVNGFHVDKAVAQLAKFQVNGRKPSLEELEESKNYFERFCKITEDMQGKTRDELIEIFNSFKGKRTGEIDNDLLVAVAAELLHRSKGKDDTESNGDYKLGSSFEINTTQYLAILTMMKTPGHVTSQIGTGEGKSRIMMISLACQNALGKTVDFVTSDAQLATRDFVEFQAYFEMIGANTGMIFANSDPSEYQKGGINFSDPSNLSLFRNKARSMARGEEVLDDNPTNRALLLDEADKTYFDVADTRFNFSKEGDDNIRGMEWVYPILIEYFAQDEVTLSDGKTKISPQELYYKDVDLSREKFLQFASGNCTSAQLMRLKALSNTQIEQWQVSAVTASQLKFKEDFVIEPDVLISTSSGPKISSEARLLFANRVSKSSKFSFGVHQCLHARLNIARQNLTAVKDTPLKEALKECEQAFYVPDEKQIVYSSTSKNLLDDYQEGTLKAVTGTAGSILEREEARQLYGEGARGKMQFVDVPRDRGLKRRDKAIRLSKNQHQQFDILVQQIKNARAKNQPILIIAENEEESASLFKKLNMKFKYNIQHVHSQLSPEKEKACVDIAGKPGQITVSTDMIGRGTDIALQDASKTHGLNVMLTYLPRVRDLEQIVGRSGRFGAKGETSIVLDKKRLKKALGKDALGSEYYRNVEAYIKREQAIKDRNKQCERLIKNTVGDFRKEVTNNFFNDMLKQVDNSKYKKLIPAWTSFFDKSDKAWNEVWPHIQAELAKNEVNIDKLETLLNEYQNNAQKMWNALRRTIQDVDDDVLCRDGTKPFVKLHADLPILKLSDPAKHLITGFNINQYSITKADVYDKYDPGHDGRAVTYKHWYTPWVASIKGWLNLLPGVHFQDARKPFANFRAWLDGRGQIFPNTRAAISRVVDAVVNLFSSKKSTEQRADHQEESGTHDVLDMQKDKEPELASYNGSYRCFFSSEVAQRDKTHPGQKDVFQKRSVDGVSNFHAALYKEQDYDATPEKSKVNTQRRFLDID